MCEQDVRDFIIYKKFAVCCICIDIGKWNDEDFNVKELVVPISIF